MIGAATIAGCLTTERRENDTTPPGNGDGGEPTVQTTRTPGVTEQLDFGEWHSGTEWGIRVDGTWFSNEASDRGERVQMPSDRKIVGADLTIKNLKTDPSYPFWMEFGFVTPDGIVMNSWGFDHPEYEDSVRLQRPERLGDREKLRYSYDTDDPLEPGEKRPMWRAAVIDPSVELSDIVVGYDIAFGPRLEIRWYPD